MRRKLLQTIFSVVALLLCMTVLTETATLATQAEGTVDLFDYGDGRTETNESIPASELFSMALGMAPTDVEAVYLDQFSKIKLSYNTAIPTQRSSTVSRCRLAGSMRS